MNPGMFFKAETSGLVPESFVLASFQAVGNMTWLHYVPGMFFSTLFTNILRVDWRRTV